MLRYFGSRAKQRQPIWTRLNTAVLTLFVSATCRSETLGDMAVNLQKSLQSFVDVIGMGAYVIGLGFAIGAIMKFKQHKDNPSNIPIGTPIALLFVAVALVFLPSLISMTGSTLSFTKSAGDEGNFDFGTK